jgi:hypothetical protein
MMTFRFVSTLALSSLLASPAFAGTLVENAFRLRSPLTTPFDTLPSGSVAVRITQGTATVAVAWTMPEAVIAIGCDGGATEAGMDYLSDVDPPAWQAPEGEWCGVRIELDEELHLIGDDLYSVPFDLEVEPASLFIGEATGSPHEDDFFARISNPGWLSDLQDYIDLEGSTGPVDPESDLHEPLIDSLTWDAWLQAVVL